MLTVPRKYFHQQDLAFKMHSICNICLNPQTDYRNLKIEAYCCNLIPWVLQLKRHSLIWISRSLRNSQMALENSNASPRLTDLHDKFPIVKFVATFFDLCYQPHRIQKVFVPVWQQQGKWGLCWDISVLQKMKKFLLRNRLRITSSEWQRVEQVLQYAR